MHSLPCTRRTNPVPYNPVRWIRRAGSANMLYLYPVYQSVSPANLYPARVPSCVRDSDLYPEPPAPS